MFLEVLNMVLELDKCVEERKILHPLLVKYLKILNIELFVIPCPQYMVIF